MRQLLRLVVESGTGKYGRRRRAISSAARPARPRSSSGRGYAEKARVASFVGAFPMNDPRYVVLVMVDEPKPQRDILWLRDRRLGRGAGGRAASSQRIAPLLGLPPHARHGRAGSADALLRHGERRRTGVSLAAQRT